MNIVLVGYRGTGKSALAGLLSERLGMKAVSTDDLIIQREGRSIPEIVQSAGWNYFRDVEAAVIQELVRSDNMILDTGGGAVLRAENREALKKNGLVFWLKAEPETIKTRIKDDTNRPPLTSGKTFIEEIADVLEQRQDAYRLAADIEIQTDGRSLDEIADEIVEHVKNRRGF